MRKSDNAKVKVPPVNIDERRRQEINIAVAKPERTVYEMSGTIMPVERRNCI